MVKDDLDEIFFDIEEFGTHVLLNNDTENPLLGIFDISTEIIFDNGSAFGESATTVPSVLMREVDAEKIEHDMSIEIKSKHYVLSYKDEANEGLVRVYLEKRR
jgi:hypothetical protein